MRAVNSSVTFFERLALALRILFSGKLARRALAGLEGASPAALAEVRPERPALPMTAPVTAPVTAPTATPDASALELLAMLQREGRLIDFVEQDIDAFGDADVGAAARAVHAGCRKGLRGCCKLAPVRAEAEEARVVIEEGYDPVAIKLTGNLSGKPPYQGTLKHAGWRIDELALPKPLAGHDARVVAPAEVEL